LVQDDTVVVADFGLARSVAVRNRSYIDLSDGGVSQRPSASLDRRRRMFRRHKCKTVVGNVYWMAPEMIHGQTYDEKVDVFSFGMICCEVHTHHHHHHRHF